MLLEQLLGILSADVGEEPRGGWHIELLIVLGASDRWTALIIVVLSLGQFTVWIEAMVGQKGGGSVQLTHRIEQK